MSMSFRQAEVCEEEGGSYTLSGCSPIVCVEPPAEETYDYNVTVYPGAEGGGFGAPGRNW